MRFDWSDLPSCAGRECTIDSTRHPSWRAWWVQPDHSGIYPHGDDAMKALVQRVSEASVTIGERTVGAIGHGLLVLLGVEHGDDEREAALLARKIAHLRIFADDAGKMNRSVLDIAGSVLVVSQFTLCADVRKGNRPSFIDAAAPELANPLYALFCDHVAALGARVARGEFATHMAVRLVNDGPVTIWLDTATLPGAR